MNEEKKLPRPSIDVLNQFDELCKQTHEESLTQQQIENLMRKMNEIIEAYDLDNYVFDDPTTGKKGVKNPAGQVLVPAEYDAFTFIGDHNTFNISHMAAQKDGKWGVVAADGTGKTLCDFRFDLLIWNAYTGLYDAWWDGVKVKQGMVSKEGKVFIPNTITRIYEPWNDFMLLESDGKFGALDVRTFCFVLPEYDDVDWEPDEDVVFHKDGVKGYIIEETGEFVPIDQFEEDEKYDDAYVYNANINI